MPDHYGEITVLDDEQAVSDPLLGKKWPIIEQFLNFRHSYPSAAFSAAVLRVVQCKCRISS
jgi:hypothetical protein